MNILADNQILLLDELFSSLGHITRYDARELDSSHLKNADVLLTRSTVKVNQELLENSPVKFVGTCTIGVDHFDTEFLDSQDIVWANAAACNAGAVVQYDLSVMAQLRPDWMQLRIGIIAAGNIGGRVYRSLKKLGVDCCCYDPFLSKEHIADLVSFDEVLSSDIIISHAPLTETGEYPTKHLLNKSVLERIRPGSLLISVGRGAVIDNQALLSLLENNKTFSVALDVWENEPDISWDLLQHVDIATPHIAGYSLEGKENGSVMVYQQLCDFLNIEPPVNAQEKLDNEKTVMKVTHETLSEVTVSEPTLPESNDHQILNQILLMSYDVMNDDKCLRTCGSDTGNLGQHFYQLRKNYPIRRELSHFILPSEGISHKVHRWMNVLQEKSECV